LTSGSATVALIVEGDDGALVAERGEVTGLYETGGVSADRACVYVPRGAANELLLTEGDCSEVMLRLTAGSASESLAARLQRTAADLGLTVESWKVLAPELDATLRILTAMERTRNAVLLGLVGLLLLNTLTLSVFERRREFGVLLAVGLSELALLALVALETVLLTAAGLGAGLVLGASAASGFPFRTGYDFGGLGRQWTGALEATGVVEPILTLDNVLTASAWVAILTFAALLLPAWRVLRLEPAAALKEAPG
jgi:ABC-type lipoprotein release transport system permease subunit